MAWWRRACLSGLLLAGLIAGSALVGLRSARADSTQHIWLHYDYMVMPDGTRLAPDPQSIQLVVDAFAAHGIDLHIDSHHTALPYHALLDLDGSVNLQDPRCASAGLGPADVVGLEPEAAVLPPDREPRVGTMISATSALATGSPGSPTCQETTSPSRSVCSAGSASSSRHFEGGTFMHELGHTLGLYHPSPNYSSNDLSVMNYRFQLGGIPYAAAPGSTSIAGRKLDYSEEALPTLDECTSTRVLGSVRSCRATEPTLRPGRIPHPPAPSPSQDPQRPARLEPGRRGRA